jgi:hypothetical protein
MEQYISKAALVAEIGEKIKKYATIDVGVSGELEALYGAKCHVLMSILSFINTLEVKEVDFEKEYKDFINSDNGRSMFETAKHFFELGLKAQKGE